MYVCSWHGVRSFSSHVHKDNRVSPVRVAKANVLSALPLSYRPVTKPSVDRVGFEPTTSSSKGVCMLQPLGTGESLVSSSVLFLFSLENRRRVARPRESRKRVFELHPRVK